MKHCAKRVSETKSCLAVNNTMLLVCEQETCSKEAHAIREEVAHSQLQLRSPDVVTPEPAVEMLACRNCFLVGETPFYRCGGCMATIYCSTECQKV